MTLGLVLDVHTIRGEKDRALVFEVSTGRVFFMGTWRQCWQWKERNE